MGERNSYWPMMRLNACNRQLAMVVICHVIEGDMMIANRQSIRTDWVVNRGDDRA
jgi:hypothetical protein